MAEQEETAEQKIAQLREDLWQQQAINTKILDIIGDIDATARSIQAHNMVIDGRLDTIDARVGLYHSDMSLSFHQVAKTMVTKQDLAASEERILAAFKDLLLIQKKGE